MYKAVFNQLLALPRYFGHRSRSGLAVFLLTALFVIKVMSQDYSWMTVVTTMADQMVERMSTTRVYGPLELAPAHTKIDYNYSHVPRAFDPNIDLSELGHLDALTLKSLILAGAPKSLAKRMTPFLPTILYFSEKNRLDPLWVLSIIWVESHFKKSATSRVHAAGLMQIMPGTGQYLNRLLNTSLPLNVSHQVNYDPYRNIELGTFYLRKLMRRFRGNYVYATVAYNMGPTYTSRQLRRRRAVGRNNHYLKKVRRAYTQLLKPFRAYFYQQSVSYKDTYVYAHRNNIPSATLVSMSSQTTK